MGKSFSRKTLRRAVERQSGVCACCGTPIHTSWSEGRITGFPHHIRPRRYNGKNTLDNCVYLCYWHKLIFGWHMPEFFGDERTGRTRTWQDVDKNDFRFFEYGEKTPG